MTTSPIESAACNSAFVSNFYQPLRAALSASRFSRACPELSDEAWLLLGVRRAIEEHPSGRAFLQHLRSIGNMIVNASTFFETLKSTRRLSLVADVAQQISKLPKSWGDEQLYGAPELEPFDLHAGDGHYHGAAAHDAPIDETKRACGHVFLLNLRTQALVHLAASDQSEKKKEHDMHVLKRVDVDMLRQGAKKGRKVLIVWDRAGIDFRFWYRLKQNFGVYFLSREKENMKLDILGLNAFDHADPRNEGVVSDELVATSQGVAVRRIRYRCPVSQQDFGFITTEFKVPPGLLAHLYRRRWNIEKVFDELKNKLGATKAWASSPTAKEMQAHFLCIAHNMLLLCERDIEEAQGIVNIAENKRREERADKVVEIMKARSQSVPFLLAALQRVTVRTVKFIRWMRAQLFFNPHREPAWDRLRELYATL